MYCCDFNHSFVQNNLFFTKVIFIQGAFKNIQGLVWKIQGLFKDIPHFFNFQGLFKEMMLFQGLFKACVHHDSRNEELTLYVCIRGQSAPSRNNDNFNRRKSVCVSKPPSKFEISRKNHIFCPVKT